MPETSRIKLAFFIIAATIMLVAFAWFMTGCTELASYEKTVDSRSIEGYAKDNNGSPQGGVKYTVHYK